MNLPPKYKQLYSRWLQRNEQIFPLSDEIELLQFLLDTEQHVENININRRAEHLLLEGYLYHVPITN